MPTLGVNACASNGAGADVRDARGRASVLQRVPLTGPSAGARRPCVLWPRWGVGGPSCGSEQGRGLPTRPETVGLPPDSSELRLLRCVEPGPSSLGSCEHRPQPLEPMDAWTCRADPGPAGPRPAAPGGSRASVVSGMAACLCVGRLAAGCPSQPERTCGPTAPARGGDGSGPAASSLLWGLCRSL